MAGKQGRRGWGHIRKLPSRRLQASYIGPDLRRHIAPHTFGARIDAEGWLATERRLTERGEWTPPAQRAAERTAEHVTLADYAARWLAHRDLKPRTRSHYQGLLKNHISKLGAIPLCHLTADAVREWHAGMTAPTARSHAYSFLHSICKTAVDDGLIPANPCRIEGAMNVKRKRQPVVLDVDQLAALAEAIRPERFKAAILIAAWCGLRWGELIELRRADIADDCSTVNVARAAGHRGGCLVDTPKDDEPRTIVIPPHIRADVKHHLDVHTASAPNALLLAPARGGCHLNDKVFRDYLDPALETLGLPKIRVHDLRHFAGTQAARVGNLVETMARLGHSTPKASMLYQQIVSGRDHEVAEALSGLAAKKS